MKLVLIGLLLLSGCASSHNPADPLEPINRSIYNFNDKLDKAVLKPVTQGYVSVMPTAAKIMVSNFFSNLGDSVATINDLLQFKLVQGFSDGMRFFVNSTIGVAGLIDVAATNGLIKHKQDFGLTLGKWGIGNGPYIVIPILGPSTLRDGIGLVADEYVNPGKVEIDHVPTRNELFVLKGIDKRASLLDEEKIIESATVDTYGFTRDAYLMYRKNLLYDGHPPRINYDEDN